MRSPSLLLGWTVVCALAAGGCVHRIGDACKQNVDCSALGDRFCDTAAINGYCTIEGCDVRDDGTGNPVDTCPGEAVCIRFYTQIASKPCDPLQELDPAACHECAVDERCLCDNHNPDNPQGTTCQESTTPSPAGTVTQCVLTPGYQGHCAPVTSERRWCQRTCNSDSDCRQPEGYECRSTGTHGAEPVPRHLDSDSGVPFGNAVKFCVPSGVPIQ